MSRRWRLLAVVACMASLAGCSHTARGELAATEFPSPVITVTSRLDALPTARVTGVLRLVDGCLMLGDQVVFWDSDAHWLQAEQAVAFGPGTSPAVVGGNFSGGGAYYSPAQSLSDVLGPDDRKRVRRCMNATNAPGSILAWVKSLPGDLTAPSD